MNERNEYIDFVQQMFDCVESTQRFWEYACKSLTWYAAIPFEKIFVDFMSSIDNDSLTVTEMKQALIKYILEGEYDRP